MKTVSEEKRAKLLKRKTKPIRGSFSNAYDGKPSVFSQMEENERKYLFEEV